MLKKHVTTHLKLMHKGKSEKRHNRCMKMCMQICRISEENECKKAGILTDILINI